MNGRKITKPRKRVIKLQILLVLAILVVSAGGGRAETTNCQAITTVPYIISTPGVYCLTENLSTSIATGNAITISASDVVIDLNGFSLRYVAGGSAEVNGIYAAGQNNITIRNGTVAGFFRGVFLEVGSVRPATSRGHIVETIHAQGNKARGIEIRGGVGSIIRRNHVDLTGGSTALIPHSIGISITGLGHRVLDNDVIDSVGTLSFGIFASGLQLIPMQDSVIELNRISRVEFGIFVGQGVMIVGNRVSFTSTGIGTLNQAPQMVFLKDNLVRGSGPYLLPANYTDAGGNYPPIP